MALQYDGILFDVDGTLIDSAPGISKTFAHTFRVMGVDDAQMDYSTFFGPPLRKSYAKYLQTADEVERAVLLYREYYEEVGQHLCALYPGVERMLQALRQAGLLLCTATSKPVSVVTPILKEQGIYPYFHVVGGASLDETVDTKTAVVQQLLRRPELCGKRLLMVGDRRDDMEGAQNCGLDHGAVLYGYGSRAELEPFRPLFLANSCEELTKYILEGV